MGGIKSHSLRREMVNRLYEVRGKKAFVEESYLANYEVPDGHFHKDITFVSGKPYRNQIDLFVGGSPCQSFSFVGHQGGFEDARGTLFYDFVRLVDDIQPKMFIGKTSRGLYHDKGKTWEVISNCFDNTGYTWHHQVLNSKDYGIPQHNNVCCSRFRNGGHEFPEQTELKTTMQDFLEDQVAGKYFLNTKGVDFVYGKRIIENIHKLTEKSCSVKKQTNNSTGTVTSSSWKKTKVNTSLMRNIS